MLKMATLLKLTSFTGNFKGFCPQIHRTAANFRKAFWRTLFLQNTSRWLFLSFKSFTKVLRVFQFYFDILLHRKCQTLLVVSSLLKKTRLAIYVYIWLPRNSACVLKHKQTWPEQAVYWAHAWNAQQIMINSLRNWAMKHSYTCTYLWDKAKLREFKNVKLLSDYSLSIASTWWSSLKASYLETNNNNNKNITAI